MEASAKDVRRVMRDLTKMVNAQPEIDDEIEETQIVLNKAMSVITEVDKDMKEVVWTRFHLEEYFMNELKEDHTLWDGTRLMEEEPRRKWEDFLKREKEKQRRCVLVFTNIERDH
jgi:hypothetical protein